MTFGYMEQEVVPPPNYRTASSFIAYQEQLARDLLALSVAKAIRLS